MSAQIIIIPILDFVIITAKRIINRIQEMAILSFFFRIKTMQKGIPKVIAVITPAGLSKLPVIK